MKRFKFYLAMVLVLCNVLSASMPVLAASVSEYSINWIQNPVEGVTGSVYGSTPYGFIIINSDLEGNGTTAVVNEDGVVLAQSEKKYTYIDEYGYIEYYAYTEDYMSEEGIMDIKGNDVIPQGKYERTYVLNENRFFVAKRLNDWGGYVSGIVDRDGNEIIPLGKYSSLNFEGGLIRAYNEENKAEMVDYDGNVIIPFGEADAVTKFLSEDRYLVCDEENKKVYLKTVDGTEIATYDGYYSPYSYQPKGTIYIYGDTTNDGRFYDYDGNECDIEQYKEEYYIDYNDEYEYVVFDKDGDEVYKCDDGRIWEIYQDKFIKIVDENYEYEGLVDINGNTIIPLGKYTSIVCDNETNAIAAAKDGKVYVGRINAVTVEVNGAAVEFDQNPVIKDGRTLVPMRAIFETLGATVEWDDKTKTATSTLGDITVKLTIGSKIMYVNDSEVELDVPAEIINSRTLVPVRAVSEAFGCDVEWDADTRTVIITE